ncbi:MAG: hypothetical protein KGP28_00495 [Bdellovibrionales bacterium]|nr:hypothetical protein [Bdellovibrionales bacterium]
MRISFASVCVLGLIFGCGSRVMDYSSRETERVIDSDPLRNADQQRRSDFSLEGKWISSCVSHPTKSSVFFKEILEFNEGRIHRTQRVALDKHCAQILYQQETESTNVISGRGEYSETREGVILLPFGAVGREMFNRGGVCGVRDWEATVAQSFDDPKVCGVARVVSGRIAVSDQSGRPRMTAETCENNPSRICYTLAYDHRPTAPGRPKTDLALR